MKWWRERPALSRVSSLKCLKCKQEQVKYKAKLSYIPIIHNSVNHFSSSPSHSPPLPSTPPHPTPPHSTPLHSTLLYSTQPHSTSSFHFTSLQLLTLNSLHSTPLHSTPITIPAHFTSYHSIALKPTTFCQKEMNVSMIPQKNNEICHGLHNKLWHKQEPCRRLLEKVESNITVG